MSLENFWPQSFDKMGRTRGNKGKKDVLSEPGDNTQDGIQGEFENTNGLDPALAKALSVMTSNIIKVINEKLYPQACYRAQGCKYAATLEFKIFLFYSTNNPSVLWETCKIYSSGLIMSFLASKRCKKNEQRKRLESQLAEMEKIHISSPNPDLLKKLVSAHAALDTFLIQDSEQSLKYARQKLYEFGDKPGRYLANLRLGRGQILKI